ncbi:Protein DETOXIFICATION 44, chloroplastic [Coccomyxa sp. Obi]|nr:Protein DETOXIFICATION 44, chloroplastic [Coccomyxa sp. Obi]
MSLVDTAFVGRLGAAQLGAVGLSTILFNFCGMLFNFLVVVTTPLVAAAVAQNDFEKASRTTAQGLWVALFLGTLTGLSIFYGAPYLLAKMGARPEVVVHALAYLRCRAIACPALLGLFVATGSFRGYQDTKTPLYSALLSNVANFLMDILFIFGLGWGVAGAALATSFSQYVGVGAMLFLLHRKRILNFADMLRIPSFGDVAPLLRAGLAVSLRNVSTMGVILYGTTMVSTMGTATLAAHEIARQVFIFSIQFFSCLDVTAQSLVASQLGKNKRSTARAVLLRILQIALGLSFLLMATLSFGRTAIPRVFTGDLEVITVTQRIMPLLAFFMPFDAAAAVMDGGLLGASETSYASRATLVVAFCVYGLLTVVPRMYPGLFGVWLSLKGLSVGRTLAASYRLASPRSPLSIETAASSHAEGPIEQLDGRGAGGRGAASEGSQLQHDAGSHTDFQGELLASQPSVQSADETAEDEEDDVLSNIVAGNILREQGSAESTDIVAERAHDAG